MELQSWLFTSDDELKAWQEISDQWLQWLEEAVPEGKVSASDIKENFPVVWKPFFEDLEKDVRFSEEQKKLLNDVNIP